MGKMTDDDLRALIGQQLSDTLSSTYSDLRQDREKALDFYHGRLLGNEIDGRSQVVSKDMMDTIEWMMPSLLRVFTRDAVQFDPVGPEDEELARQETDYVTHVLWKKNPGFMVLYTWIKDALMQKVGYVKYFWEDEEKLKFDEYTGLTDDQLVKTITELEQQGEIEVVGYRNEDGLHSIKTKCKKKYGCAKVEPTPPEEVIVHSKCRGEIKKARFVGHMLTKTRSDLLEMGYKRSLVKTLTSYDWAQGTSESVARDTVSEHSERELLADGADWATQELRLLEAYLYVDVDDDGIAELRRVLLAGNEILENEEFPEIPFESWTPIPVPHRHVGLGIYDIIEDLQRIKTALQRGLLDNVYFTNAPRLVYNRDTVDRESLQINRPGGHVANRGPVTGAVEPVPVQPIAGRLLPVIDYIDGVKETRTGVGRISVGVDADVLAQSTKGAYMDAKGAANQRIEAIARIFAETGLSSLYQSLHRLLMRHQDWTTRAKLRNRWVDVSPTEWMERANLTVSVGLGNASREEIRANLMLMSTAQEKAAAIPGLIQPKNVFSLFRRVQAELGFEQDNFITDPESPEYAEFMRSQQGRTDPYIQGEQIKSQTRMQEKMIDSQDKAMDRDQERALKITELEVDSAVDLAKAGIGAEVAVARGASQAQRSGPAAP